MYQAPPPQIPTVPQHNGKPQSGWYYQYGDPGPAIGKLKSVDSTFGQQPPRDGKPPSCTFVGDEGIARAQFNGMQVLRFADAPYCLVTQKLRRGNGDWEYVWSFLDAYYRTLFWTEDADFGGAAELAHANFLLEPALKAHVRGEPVRFWGAPPRGIVITGENVEVIQAMRRDVVNVKDLTVSIQDDDLVLESPAFHEARFFQAETYNLFFASAMLKMLAKRAKEKPAG